MRNTFSSYRLGLTLCAIAAMLLLSGCDIGLLNPKGMIAAEEKKLFLTAIALMLVIVIPVMILIVVIPWRYRASNTHATYKPNWSHSTALEIVWWTIPIIIILILASITWLTTHSLDPYKPIPSKKEPVVIEVIALDWKWLFIYPQYHVATVNFMQIPIDTPIAFKITSDAPMNGFMIPQLGSQIYAMQGMQTQLHLIADTLGDYNGQSTNYSGSGFAGMKFIARVSTEQDFQHWISSLQTLNHPLSPEAFATLEKQSSYDPIMLFSDVAPNLYENTIMKYMTAPHHHMTTSAQHNVTQ